MNCDEFLGHLDQRGDDRHLTEALAAHAQGCEACSRLWQSLRQLVSPGDATSVAASRRAERRLRATLARHGRPSVRFGSLSTPIGVVFVAVSPKGVFDVTFGMSSTDRYVTRLASRVCDVMEDARAVRTPLEELRAYFEGDLTRFTVPVDLTAVTAFTARVLRATRRIPYGRLRSYGDIAERIGSPLASRAVGGALGRNPVPIVIPCHRVVAGGGGIGGFTGGLPTKRALLRIEGHAVSARAVQ